MRLLTHLSQRCFVLPLFLPPSSSLSFAVALGLFFSLYPRTQGAFQGSWYTVATLVWSVACCASSSALARVAPLSRRLLSMGCGPV